MLFHVKSAREPKSLTSNSDSAFDEKILYKATIGMGAKEVAEIHQPMAIAQLGKKYVSRL